MKMLRVLLILLVSTGCANSMLPTSPSAQTVAPAAGVTDTPVTRSAALIVEPPPVVDADAPMPPAPPMPTGGPESPMPSTPAPASTTPVDPITPPATPPPVVVPPVVIPCAQVQRATAAFSGWTLMTPTLIGSVVLNNGEGVWTVRLLGSATAYGPATVLESISVPLACGQTVGRTVSVNWQTQPFGFVWIEASLDGTRLLMTDVIAKSTS